MLRFPSCKLINKAFDLAIARLEDQYPTSIEPAHLNPLLNSPPLSKDIVAIFLKYLLLQDLETAEIGFWRERWKQDKYIPLRTRLQGLMLDIRNWLNSTTEPPLPAILAQQLADLLLPHYHLLQERILDLAVEAVLTEPLAPEICFKFSPLIKQVQAVKLPGRWQHAVIFAAPYFFSHEFYPLAVDAYVHDAELHGELRINVLGAHTDWLTEEGNLKRILYLDFAMNRLVETNLAPPIRPDSVQFLCLGKNEQAIHQALSQSFSCLQLNPFSASNLADDKAITLAGWAALGLDVPNFLKVEVGDYGLALFF